MVDCQFLLTSWEDILQKLQNNHGSVHPIKIGKKATIQEIEAKEKELGYSLPPSYKYILQNIGKSLSFYYSFSEDTMIPREFNEIFSGEIDWDIDYLQSLESLADDLMEDGEDYGKALRGKLEFSHSGNGDVYAFDMSVESEEKPVIYWDHEEDTVTYIADSFIDYLLKITELGCIGSEKWQFEYFLSNAGLVTSSPAAIKWKHWFTSFSETTLNDVKNNMEQLIAFVVYRNSVDNETIGLLQRFNRKELFDFCLEELSRLEAFREQMIICEIIGTIFREDAGTWVRSLWQDKQNAVDARLRSFLTSMCMSKDEGLRLVFDFLEQVSTKKINGYEALVHLMDFHSRDVIPWMEKHLTFPVTEGWDELFVRSNFSWADLKRWTLLDEKHEVTILHALDTYVDEKNSNKPPHKISDFPTQTDFQEFLISLRDKQVLKKRIVLVDKIIQNIHVFY